MERFNRKPNHASYKATAKFAALQAFVYWSAAVLRESFNSILQDASVTAGASERLSVEWTSRADVCAAICLILTNLAAANRKTVEKAHAEPDDVSYLKGF